MAAPISMLTCSTIDGFDFNIYLVIPKLYFIEREANSIIVIDMRLRQTFVMRSVVGLPH